MKRVYRLFKKNWISLVGFEISYGIAVSILFAQCAGLFINFSLKQQNYSYLTAENYVSFVKHPVTIVLGFVLLVLLALLTLIEVQAVFAYFRYGIRKQKLYAVEMLIKGIKNSFFFIKDHPFVWGLYILGTLPFLAVHFLIQEISNVKFLEYTAIQLYKVIPSKGLIFFLLAVLFSFSLMVSFSLPYCILEKEKIRPALRRTWRLLSGRRGKNLVGIIAVQVLVVVATVAVYLLCVLIMVAGVVIFLKPSYRFSGVLYYGKWLKNALAIFAGSFGFIFGIHYVGLFYSSKETNSSQVWKRAGSGKRWFARRRGRYIAALLTLVMITAETGYLVYLSTMNSKLSIVSPQQPYVTAHRGGALKTPENTMSAINYAVESMSDYAEIDVQETKDGVVVLLHDTNLKRVTGLNEQIWKLTYAEVAQLDAGVKFNVRFLGEKIPTLDEVIEYAKGKIKLNIEVKANGHNENIVSKVIRSIEQYDFQNSCVITSMNYRFLQQVKEVNPDIVTGYTMTMAYGSVKYITDADFVSVKSTYIDRQFVEDAHSSGKEVHAWTVNYPGDVKRMMSCGVDNIITDDPSMVHQVYLGDGATDTGFWRLVQYVLK